MLKGKGRGRTRGKRPSYLFFSSRGRRVSSERDPKEPLDREESKRLGWDLRDPSFTELLEGGVRRKV